MVSEFQTPISAEAVKAKAREFGADLVGIADGMGAVDTSSPYSFTQSTTLDRTLVSGVTSPFNGYSMGTLPLRTRSFRQAALHTFVFCSLG